MFTGSTLLKNQTGPCTCEWNCFIPNSVSMSDYRIERITADQFDLLVPLMKDCFGMDTDINYFKWKYVENPAGSFIGFIALQEATSEVAAYYGVIPQVLVIEGEERMICQ